jgi:hypothetical protein
VIGVSVYVFPYRRSKRTWKAGFLVAASIVACYISPLSPRPACWLRTYYEGDVSGRDEIYEIAADMISETPAGVVGRRVPELAAGGRKVFWTGGPLIITF